MLLDDFIHIPLSATCGEETQINSATHCTLLLPGGPLSDKQHTAQVVNVITDASVTSQLTARQIYMTVNI